MSVAATVYSYCIALFVPNMISTDPKVIGKFTVVSEFEYPHCFYQQTARYPKPVKVYRESKTNPVTPTLTLLKWLIECHKNVDPFASYPVEKAQNVPFTESGKVKLTFL